MKDLCIATVFILSAIFAVTAISSAASAFANAPVVSKTGPQNSVASRHTKYI